MLELKDWFMANWQDMVYGVLLLVLVGEVIVRLTPTKSDDGFIFRVGKYMDQLLKWFPNVKKPSDWPPKEPGQ
jgi:hypothetical protein